MIKLLLGGSPCTHWSIAQSKNRETEPSGEGWELFGNFLIAKERFRPDLFLYENNKSAAKPIKDQISKELGAPLQYINSALVSAQSRERFYCHNFGGVPQPEDREILLRDILECPAVSNKEKAYTLRASAGTKQGNGDIIRHIESGGRFGYQGVLEPTRISVINYSPPNNYEIISSDNGLRCAYKNNKHTAQGYHVQLPETKMRTLAAGQASKEKVIIPVEDDHKYKPVYRIENNKIEIKGKLYPIKLPDGFYIIRKLTVTECCRLQTLPDNYCRAVSPSQGYRGLGNGWTAEVIIHLLSYALRGVPKDEKITVLSMYDGIGTGRYCFDKLGYGNITYYAYEIDKYAMQVSMSNYPDIIQCGDAFKVRDPEWFLADVNAVAI